MSMGVVNLSHVKKPSVSPPPPVPTGPRMAWPGGKISTNRDDATKVFVQRLKQKRARGETLTSRQTQMLAEYDITHGTEAGSSSGCGAGSSSSSSSSSSSNSREDLRVSLNRMRGKGKGKMKNKNKWQEVSVKKKHPLHKSNRGKGGKGGQVRWQRITFRNNNKGGGASSNNNKNKNNKNKNGGYKKGSQKKWKGNKSKGQKHKKSNGKYNKRQQQGGGGVVSRLVKPLSCER